MLDKNGRTLYDTKLYKTEKKFINGDNEIEKIYALGNALCLLAKECIIRNNTNPLLPQISITNDNNPIIDLILQNEPATLDLLYDLQETNRNPNSTLIGDAILVCEAHIKKERTR